MIVHYDFVYEKFKIQSFEGSVTYCKTTPRLSVKVSSLMVHQFFMMTKKVSETVFSTSFEYGSVKVSLIVISVYGVSGPSYSLSASLVEI